MLGNADKRFGSIQNFSQQSFVKTFYGQKVLEFAGFSKLYMLAHDQAARAKF
jgi:hypothetical protein